MSIFLDDLLPTDYVPYIDYKANLDIYQWIGAGRDSDAKLMLLCETWLKNKDEVAARVVEDESIIPFVLREEFDVKREQRSVSPASTRFPTDWVVKPSSFEEKEDFRKQVGNVLRIYFRKMQNISTSFLISGIPSISKSQYAVRLSYSWISNCSRPS